MTYDKDDLYKIKTALVSGRFGGFAAYLGDALSVADMENTRRLVEAFPEIMEQALSLTREG